MRIDNHEEYEAAKRIVEDAEKVAAALWRWKHPDKQAPASFCWGAGAEEQAAWDLACDIADGYTGNDPDAAAEALADWLRDQPDPSADHKAYSLSRAA